MEKRNKIYEGKGKIVYATDSPDYIIQYFKDEATAFNAAKKGIINQKGVLNNKISAKIFQFLIAQGIPTHYEKILNDREVLVKKVEIIPIEVIVRNIAAGSLCRNLGLREGEPLACSILEFCYKDDNLNDPLVNEYHIKALNLATDEEVEVLRQYAFKLNDLLSKFFKAININLVDTKFEFGRLNGQVVLADEISPDTCRLWEIGTGRKLDKDCFRRDLGNTEQAYREVLDRMSQEALTQ